MLKIPMKNPPTFSNICPRYHGISNNSYNPINSYTLLILIVHSNSFIDTKVKLLFYCSYSKNAITMRWPKYAEMVYLKFRNANKHILLVLGVVSTARDPVKVKASQDGQANAVELASKVCFLMFT